MKFKFKLIKKVTWYSLGVVLITAIVSLVSCTKENSDIRLAPTLAGTSNTLNITSDSATVVGFVIAQGDGFTEKGVCYNTSESPTIDNNKVVYTEGGKPAATFYVTLSGLHYATQYYARAYATGNGGTVYGEQVTFTTLSVVPFLTTAAITEITGNSATGGGEVTDNGGADVSARGICYSMEHNPTIANDKTTDGDGSGAFVSMLSNLKGNTTYYVRAYATNSVGTGYGPEVSFTTLVDLPEVTTSGVTGITKTSAISGGEVTDDGGADITARGLAWGMNPDPTITDHIIDGGMGMGTFVSNLTNLDKNTTYYVRAYATNSAGTGYGESIEFTTLADILTWYIPGDYVEASYPGREWRTGLLEYSAHYGAPSKLDQASKVMFIWQMPITNGNLPHSQTGMARTMGMVVVGSIRCQCR